MSAPPELDEIVAAIRECIAAADAFNSEHVFDLPSTDAARRWDAIFVRLRSMVEEIDAGLAEEFGSAS